MRTIVLAGPSGAGKSTLAKALCYLDSRTVISTSKFLRAKLLDSQASGENLGRVGDDLDASDPYWLSFLIANHPASGVVVDAIRSKQQERDAGRETIVRVNVVAPPEVLAKRQVQRGRGAPEGWSGEFFMFDRPDYTWRSDVVPLSSAVRDVGLLSGSGCCDVIVGGQYGSEGKGKLAALLAPNYQILVRSGGPNAGHWVRNFDHEFCFHQVPSGALANRGAAIFIAAGATLNPKAFWDEVERAGIDRSRVVVDYNTVMIDERDRTVEGKLVDIIGSTAQGVGSAASRRLLRGMSDPVVTAADSELFKGNLGKVSGRIDAAMSCGSRVLLEGTQGSELSLYHGPYPFTTSRDTNAAGLISEVGVPPCSVRDTWMVVRSYPIRVGGNSGPMYNETTWDKVAERADIDPVTLRQRELTSTTRRQRRVGEWDPYQFARAVGVNRPTRLFLTFADYLDPRAREVNRWADLPGQVRAFADHLEDESGVPVAGVSTGRMQSHTCMRDGYL